MARKKSKVDCPYFEFLVCNPSKRDCWKCGWYAQIGPAKAANISDKAMDALERMGRKAHEGKEKDDGQ